jgi:hypothetical protein
MGGSELRFPKIAYGGGEHPQPTGTSDGAIRNQTCITPR